MKVPPEIGRVELDPAKMIWLWGMAVPGLVWGVPSLTGTTLAVSLGLVFFTLCVGHSVGLHRGVIHRTYHAGPLVRGALAYLFVLSGLGGPLSWARLHAIRDYWQNRADCPRYFAYDHSMARDFWWNLHLRFVPADSRCDSRLPPFVLDDRWLGFLEASWPLHVLSLTMVIQIALGPEAVAVCVCARTAAGIVGHWAVGYSAHKWGERRFRIAGARESGTNIWILGVLSFGEGFHNNHHAFPNSPRMGMRPGEFDLGWVVIRTLEKLGLVHARRRAYSEARVDSGAGWDGAASPISLRKNGTSAASATPAMQLPQPSRENSRA
jgi:stearoyl-CoA desaturase (delta-9 desaturase)